MIELFTRPFMQSRQESLDRALAGLERTDTPLVAELPNGQLAPAGFTDDVGIYLFVPALARWLDISIPQAQGLFLGGVMGVSLLVGLLATWAMVRHWSQRLVATITLVLIAIYGLYVWDVYVISAAVPLLLVPVFLYLLTRPRLPRWSAWAFLLAGVVVGTGNLIRSQAGTVALVFLAVALLGTVHHAAKTRLSVLGFVLIGLGVTQLYSSTVIVERDRYLQAHQPGYEVVVDVHPLWHSVYIGFGYLNNPLGITYSDSVADQAARSVKPDVAYVSAEYEAILKDKVFELLRTEPRFFLDTIFAKLGVVFFFLLKFANVGLIAKFVTRLPAWQEWAFWSTLGFSALPGLLVIPAASYLMGFLATAALYGMTSINAALAQGWLGLIPARR